MASRGLNLGYSVIVTSNEPLEAVREILYENINPVLQIQLQTFQWSESWSHILKIYLNRTL